MIIGITGGTGCGKTTALSAIRQLGGTVLDCDTIYHELLQTDNTLLDAIEKRFPGTVEKGILQRKKLGEIVFADAKALQDLNRITHSAVKAEVLRRLDKCAGLAAIDAIALFESGLDKLCKLTVAITAPEEDRVARLMARENIPEDYARKRIAAQPSQEEFTRLCDYHLHNDGTYEEFLAKCLAFFQDLAIIKEKS